MKTAFLIIVLLPLLQPGNLWGQKINADPLREKNFAYEVKIMDEFIQRFNDYPATFLRQYINRTNRGMKFGRKEMLATLFNHPETISSNKNAQSLLRQVLDPAQPQSLRFNDSNWYAEVLCRFDFDGRIADIPLILQIDAAKDKSAKWMITGIGDSYVFRNETLKETPASAGQPNNAQSISPTGYATNFLELHRVLKPSMNAATYFSPQLLETERGKKFVQLIKEGNLTYSYAGLTRFHIFQIPGYLFIVERFTRPTTNSGWLITDIQNISDDDLAARKESLLQRTL